METGSKTQVLVLRILRVLGVMRDISERVGFVICLLDSGQF